MVWAVNNFSNGIPMASINVSFSDFEPSLQLYTNDLGYVLLPDFIGQRWTSNGATSYNTVTSSCGYDSVSNSTTTTLDQDQIIYCLLELDNQAPFVNWDTPFDGMIYPSKGEILFNASRSWDLDNDPLSFTWTSSIDGDIVAGCAGVFQSPNHPADGAAFLVNGDPLTQVPPYCELSDGIHAITLDVCDPLYCVGETRTIELVNLAPALMVEFEPGLNPWSELIMPQTGTVVVNTTGSFDPEGDDFACVIDFNGEGFAWGSQWVCPEELTYTFDYTTEDPPASAELTVMAFDAVGNNATYSVPVILYNEIPEPRFTIARDTNSSESLVTLDGSATIDPEGDSLTTTYISSLDGILNDGSTIWEGYLSRGVHTLTMEVTDDRAEHANQSRSTSTLITVENSLPRAIIGTPVSQTFESSELIEFSANGSGDFDAACDTFPTDGAWHCAPFSPFGGSEFLVVTWTSDLDGRLTPEGEDWLYFDGRLTAGVHTITLSVDDGIHDPVLAQQTVTIVASAPVLGLVSPLNGSQSLSSQTLMFDASQSLDYDGDAFTVTLRSSLHTEPLLVDVDPFNSHAFNLKAGQHILTVTLTDESGDSRDESFVLTVVESEPTLVLISPENRASIEPGGVLRLEEASFDADNDLTVREWRKWSTQTSFPEVLSTSSIEELSGLTPGEYHLSLYVEDARGQWVEEHVNITIQSSLPSLDRDSLSLSETTFSQDELHRLTISIRLEDADGTTQDVRANLTLNIQQWEVNLTDEDGDGVWEGILEWRPESTGRPSLKIIAKDGQGETANVDVVTRTLVVEVQETDQRALVLGASLAGLIAFVGLLAFVLARRKRALEDIDLLASWDAFRAPAGEANTDEKNIPSLEENIMDGTEEVQATLEELE